MVARLRRAAGDGRTKGRELDLLPRYISRRGPLSSAQSASSAAAFLRQVSSRSGLGLQPSRHEAVIADRTPALSENCRLSMGPRLPVDYRRHPFSRPGQDPQSESVRPRPYQEAILLAPRPNRAIQFQDNVVLRKVVISWRGSCCLSNIFHVDAVLQAM